MKKLVLLGAAFASLNCFAKKYEIREPNDCATVADFNDRGNVITAPGQSAQDVLRRFAKEKKLHDVNVYANAVGSHFKKQFHVFYTGLNTFDPNSDPRVWSVGVDSGDYGNPDIPYYVVCLIKD